MDERSDDLHDQPSQVEGSQGMGRERGDELPSVDREGRARMEWISFTALNQTFQVEGPEGAWVDQVGTAIIPGWNKGILHTEETKKLMSRNQPKTKVNKGWCDEAKKRRSEMQKGKKRGKYKTSVVRTRDERGRFT
jgi:hypothetical protein